jgi:uncharacterized membrane protein
MTRYYWIAAAVLVALAAGASAWLYPSLPEQIPTHWNIKGEIDGYGDKAWAMWIMPLLMIGMLVLFAFLPALSPRHFEVDRFRSTYLYIMVLVTAFLGYMHGVVLYGVWQSTAGGNTIDIGRPLIAGIFLFFALLGNVIGKVRKNFYIGFRVPWTLASDRVWNDTHRVAAWVMVAAGLVGFVVTISGFALIAAFVVLPGSMLIPVIYSFVHYKALEKRGAL